MIIVRVEGGLANKMFQYAFFMAILRVRKDVYLDEMSFKPTLAHEFLSLTDVFPKLYFPTTGLEKFKCQTQHTMWYKFKRTILEKFSKYYFHESELRYYPCLIENLPAVCYLRGYWQTEKYFMDFKDEILRTFSFPEIRDERNLDLFRRLVNENSVAIHVRQGADYAKEGRTTICDIQYYENAIAHMTKNVPDPKFYIFADNKEWVLKNIKGIDYTLVDWNPLNGEGNHIDMQLMSMAKHNIIANSSYSWWGAWLNRNPTKIVVTPKIWYKLEPKYNHCLDILPDSWVKY